MATKLSLVAFCLLLVVCCVTAIPHPIGQSSYNNPYVRTYPYQKEKIDCRNGLCPLPKRLVPDLTANPPYYGYGARSYTYDDGEPSLCGNLCTTDTFCPEGQKCCPTTCGYACQETVHLAE